MRWYGTVTGVYSTFDGSVTLAHCELENGWRVVAQYHGDGRALDVGDRVYIEGTGVHDGTVVAAAPYRYRLDPVEGKPPA